MFALPTRKYAGWKTQHTVCHPFLHLCQFYFVRVLNRCHPFGFPSVCSFSTYASAESSHESSPPLVNFQDQVWPRDSAFASVSQRLPVTRRITLQGSTPHEILLQATDQFSRGMLHMPNARRPRSAQHHHKGGSYFSLHHLAEEDLEEIDAPPTLPGLGVLETRDATSIRPRVLYAIASDVMSVAERLPDPAAREYWANWSDVVFRQMEMESDVRSWVYATAVGRGRCWLIIGAARAEALEVSMDSIGEAALQSGGAAEAREALYKGEHTFRHRTFFFIPLVPVRVTTRGRRRHARPSWLPYIWWAFTKSLLTFCVCSSHRAFRTLARDRSTA